MNTFLDPYESVRVSTHSRLKAAGKLPPLILPKFDVSTHSRPKAAGGDVSLINRLVAVSTHSRPKAAGYYRGLKRYYLG